MFRLRPLTTLSVALPLRIVTAIAKACLESGNCGLPSGATAAHPAVFPRRARTAAGMLLALAGVALPVSLNAQMVVAHRGASAAAPENTLAAFRLAWQQGADAIEGDFYLTRDGHIVAIHDKTTERTADRDLAVETSTLAELKKLDMGSWKGTPYAGERIPTLAEVLAIVPPDKTIFIEIKCGPEIVPPLKKTLEQSGLTSAQTVVIAFDEDVIRAVKQYIPQVKAYWLVSYQRDEKTGRLTPSVSDVLASLEAIGADGLDTQDNRDVVNRTFVKELRKRGLGFHVWTVDDPQIARYYQQLGVDSITTNRPGAIRKALRGG